MRGKVCHVKRGDFHQRHRCEYFRALVLQANGQDIKRIRSPFANRAQAAAAQAPAVQKSPPSSDRIGKKKALMKENVWRRASKCIFKDVKFVWDGNANFKMRREPYSLRETLVPSVHTALFVLHLTSTG